VYNGTLRGNYLPPSLDFVIFRTREPGHITPHSVRMMSVATDAIYANVIDDVIKNVKRDFEAAGYTEETLDLLREVCLLYRKILHEYASSKHEPC